MKRVHNFSAGPSALPQPVLEELRDEALSYKDFGASAFEVSHRSPEFIELFEDTRDLALKLLGLSTKDYELVFLHGGARFLFATLPLNFARKDQSIGVVHSGVWTQKAIEEIQKHCHCKIVASGEQDQFSRLPQIDPSKIEPSFAYLHYCSNNTIYGTQFREFVTNQHCPTVVDMSSDILSRKIDYSQFDAIFASAQKNLGAAGLTLLAIKRTFLAKASEDISNFLQIKKHAEQSSMFNTPSTIGIYLTGKVLKWIDEMGIEKIEAQNRSKSKALYDFIDQSSFYNGIASPESRSDMNVVFRVRSGAEEIEKRFVEESKQAGLIGLKGHRAIGGLRASLYNAVSKEDVDALLSFMEKFEQKHSG